MRCNYCGTEIKSGMKYCPVCGKEQGVKKGSAEHGTGTIFGGDGIPGTITEDPQKPEKYKKEKKKRKKERK